MSEWEDMCLRCGLCCFEKTVDRQDRFVTTKVPCKHLDIVTRQCRVYQKRLTVSKGCVQLTPELVASADWLPATCAYRSQCTDDSIVSQQRG